MTIERPPVFAMEDALVRLQRMIGDVPEWTRLEKFLPHEFSNGKALDQVLQEPWPQQWNL